MEGKKHIRFDWAIKSRTTAGLRDKANFDILEGFLSELLKEDIKIENILESAKSTLICPPISNLTDPLFPKMLTALV